MLARKQEICQLLYAPLKQIPMYMEDEDIHVQLAIQNRKNPYHLSHSN